LQFRLILEELKSLRVLSNRQKDKIQELKKERESLVMEILKETALLLILLLQFLYLLLSLFDSHFRSTQMLEEELDHLKREYTYLLQSCMQIPLSDQFCIDSVQVKLHGGDMHKTRVLKLLDEARNSDPTLPTLESIISLGNYVDAYGFRHSFEDEGLALHYICTLLQEHYKDKSMEEQMHRVAWRQHLKKCNNQLQNNKETQKLVRAGIPNELRTEVWTLLIDQQTADIKLKYGKYYFQNLCNSKATESERLYYTSHQKQVTLDLLRTMPNNVHFTSPNCKGILQLEQVLRAYCLHNPSIGYCQGMNFIAATAMLVLGAEETFWFLVALTERYFNSSYFDQTLTGAQADQEVLKQLLVTRLPRLSAHFESFDIDLATLTLNWFIAIYFDAVPFQTMIRIWDCFLLEGPKVLFRFAVGLLAMYEDELLQRTDTISVMKVLKASVRLTFDYQELFNASTLLVSVQIKFCIYFVYILFKFISAHISLNVYLQFDCRILSLAVVSKGTVFVSLLSSTIVSLRSNISSHLYNAFESTTNELELFNLPIGAAPISDMIIVDDTLWLALACKIVVLNASTLTTVKNIYIASSINGTNMAMFEKIRCFTASPFGVWTVTVNSTVIQLWKDSDCLLLYDISYDHLHRLPSLSERSDKIEQLWVGTNDGHVFIYSACKSNNSNGQAAVDGQFKYPAGKRLLPTFSYDNSGMSSVSCYIPTANETEIDEQNSVAEFSHHRRRAQKFSATRQCNTRQFLGNNTFKMFFSNSPLALFSPSLLPHQESNDSAVSVFFPEENNDAARYRSFSCMFY
uniref:Rab-GAP TBC domain-containing protein n=1 Tax=Syphacia muris TaxID=451379 RepID=A0A0N5AWE4_9BILA